MARPIEVVINSDDWYCKVLGMLQQNWALIGKEDKAGVKVYFFYDLGHAMMLEYALHETDGMSGIIDCMSFSDRAMAVEELECNGFLKHYDQHHNDHMKPQAPYFDASHSVDGPYSTGEYWV